MGTHLKLLIIFLIFLAFISLSCESLDNTHQINLVYEPDNDNFSFKNGGWVSKASMNVPRKYLAGATHNDKIYVFGGIGSEQTVLNSVEVYDPVLDKWKLNNSMPVSLYEHIAISFSNKIYLLGGNTGSQNLIVNSLYEYDPELDLWNQKANMPYRRSAFTAVLFNEKIYVFGGLGESPEKVLEYSIKEDKWIVKNSPMPTIRHHLISGIGNDWIYTINGINNNKTININEVYNPELDRWFIRKNPTTPRHSSVSVTIRNRIYMIGGYDTQGSFRLNEYYDTKVDRWTKMTPMLTNRYGHISVLLDTNIYIIGGATIAENPPLAITEMYEP